MYSSPPARNADLNLWPNLCNSVVNGMYSSPWDVLQSTSTQCRFKPMTQLVHQQFCQWLRIWNPDKVYNWYIPYISGLSWPCGLGGGLAVVRSPVRTLPQREYCGALVVWPGMQFPNLGGRIHQSPVVVFMAAVYAWHRPHMYNEYRNSIFMGLCVIQCGIPMTWLRTIWCWSQKCIRKHN
jgi:hypothetical protein